MRVLPYSAVFCGLLLSACSQRISAPVREVWLQPDQKSQTYKVLPHETLYAVAFRFDLDFRQLAQWNQLSAPYAVVPGQVLRLTGPGATPAMKSAVPPLNAHAGTPASSTAVNASSRKPIMYGAIPPRPALSQAAVHSATLPGAVVDPAPSSKSKARVLKAPLSTSPTPSATPLAPESAPREKSDTPFTVQPQSDYWAWPANGDVHRSFSVEANQKGVDIKGVLHQPILASRAGVVAYSGNGLPGYGHLVIIKHDDEYLTAYGYNAKVLVHEGNRVKEKQKIAEMGTSGSGVALLHFEIRKAGKPVNPILYLGQHRR